MAWVRVRCPTVGPPHHGPMAHFTLSRPSLPTPATRLQPPPPAHAQASQQTGQGSRAGCPVFRTASVASLDRAGDAGARLWRWHGRLRSEPHPPPAAAAAHRGGAPRRRTRARDGQGPRGAWVLLRVDSAKVVAAISSAESASWRVHSSEEMSTRFGRGVKHGRSDGTADTPRHHARLGPTAMNQTCPFTRHGRGDQTCPPVAVAAPLTYDQQIHTTSSSEADKPP